jgi:hypothetical protein
LDKVEHFYQVVEYDRLHVIVRFIDDAIGAIDKDGLPPTDFSVHQNFDADIYDDIAQVIFEVILAAASVRSPPWTSWAIQHNTVWSDIFGLRDSGAHKIIAIKVRRLCYDEIKEMDDFPNFKGAKILGFCLHVLGLTPIDRHGRYQKNSIRYKRQLCIG